MLKELSEAGFQMWQKRLVLSIAAKGNYFHGDNII
jgi:hypothetical protein